MQCIQLKCFVWKFLYAAIIILTVFGLVWLWFYNYLESWIKLPNAAHSTAITMLGDTKTIVVVFILKWFLLHLFVLDFSMCFGRNAHCIIIVWKCGYKIVGWPTVHAAHSRLVSTSARDSLKQMTNKLCLIFYDFVLNWNGNRTTYVFKTFSFTSLQTIGDTLCTANLNVV